MSEIGGVSIKITLDDSAIKAQLNDIKSSLKSVSKINTGSTTKGLTSGLKQATNSAKTLKREIVNVKDASGKLKSSIKETATSIRVLEDGTKEITKDITNINSEQKKSGVTLNNILGSSMKVLRITTTITAVYALIKTAINAWLNTIKAVFSVYQKLGQVIAGVVTQTSKFVYEFSGAKTVMNAINSVLGDIVGKVKEAFSVDNIKNFISESNELASSLVEVKNILATIYDESAQNDITGWAQNIYSTFGLNEANALKYNTRLGAMFNSAGFDSATYSAMSKNLTQLTSDLASLYNMDFDTVFQKIQSGMAGQTKGMLSFGISVHKATIEEFLLNNGINANYNSLSLSAKMYARYAYMIQAAADYQGDFNKTQWQYANNMRVVSQLIETIKMQIGSLIYSVLTPLTIVLRVVLEEISEIISQTLKLFNIDIENSSLTSIGDDYASMLDDMYNDTNETVKKIKRSLTSFDELHQLKGDDDESGLDGSVISLQDLIDKLGVSYKKVEEQEPKFVGKIREMIQKIKDAWLEKDFTDIGRTVGQKLKEGFMWINSHWKEIFSVFEGIGKSLATFLNGLFEDPSLFTEVARTLAGSIKSIMITAYGFLANLKPENIGGGIGAFINGIFETDEDGFTLLDIFARNIALAINNLSIIISEALSGLDYTDIGTKIANSINLLFNSIDYANLGTAASKIASSVLNSLSVAFQNIDWKSIGFNIDTFLQNLFAVDENGNSFLDTAATVLTGFVNGLITTANTVLSGEGFEQMRKEISDFFRTVCKNLDWSGLSSLILTLKDEISGIVKEALLSVNWWEVIKTAVPIISEVLASAASFIGAALLLTVLGIAKKIAENCVETFTTIVKGILEVVQGIIETIVGLIEGIITGDFENFKSGIATFLSGLADVIGGGIKTIVGVFSPFTDWIDGAIEKVKNFINEIMGVNKIDGTTINLNHSGGSISRSIPHLANGGYVKANNPQLAVVGDNKARAEIISPDDKIAAIFDERINNFFNNGFVDLMAAAFSKAIGNNSGKSGTTNVYLDGQLIARAMLSEQEINNARGRR